MKIVYMGTPDFAVGTRWRRLVEAGHEVVAVVTQPDKPKGRGKAMHAHTGKRGCRSKAWIPVYQPVKGAGSGICGST